MKKDFITSSERTNLFYTDDLLDCIFQKNNLCKVKYLMQVGFNISTIAQLINCDIRKVYGLWHGERLPISSNYKLNNIYKVISTVRFKNNRKIEGIHTPVNIKNSKYVCLFLALDSWFINEKMVREILIRLET